MPRQHVPSVGRVILTVLKWSPVLAIGFVVFMSETALQLRIRANDYIVREQRRMIRELRTSINLLEAQEDEREAMDLIGAKAEDMGLVEPQPDQIEVLYVVEDDSLESRPSEFVDVPDGVPDIASLDGQEAEPAYATTDQEDASWPSE
ncbi:MAG: hypothetical protein GY851_30905 [bacterium]|nr:hypothetical protein [bacterium]